MAKLTLTDITSGYASTTAVNNNNTLIENALENTLSRDGTGPNTMGADLDMNSNAILNASGLTLNGVSVVPTGTTTISASGMTYLPAGTGAVASTVQRKLREFVSVFDYMTAAEIAGCVNGSVDVTTAIQTALNNHDCVYLPVGVYKTTSKITVPLETHFLGAHSLLSIIKPSAAVTGAAIEYFGTTSVMENIFVDGVNTTGAIGIRVGGNSLSADSVMRKVQVWRFTGTGARGIQIVNMVRMSFHDVYVSNNETNLDIGSTSAGSFPDALAFYDCSFHTAVGTGVLIKTGFQISFWNCTSEANGGAGYLVSPDAGQLINGVNWYGGWCESNWLGVASGVARHAEYHIDINGTAAGASIINCGITDTYFNGDANSCAAIHVNKAYYTRLRGPVTQQLAGAIVVDNASSSGWLDEYQGYASYFTDNSGNIRINDSLWDNATSAWTSWTPVYSSSVGNAAATFTGTPTTTRAKYKKVGKTLYLSVSWSSTLLAITPSWIGFTLPTDIHADTTDQWCSIGVTNGATTETGLLRSGDDAGAWANMCLQYRANFANYGSGAAVGGQFNVVLETY